MTGPIRTQTDERETMLRNAHRLLRTTTQWRCGFHPLWSFVSEITGHGSAYSIQICRDYGWNPDAEMKEPLPRRGDPAIDMDLWHRVQKIVYPKRFPSDGAPFPPRWRQGPKREPASWLYHLLAGDAQLRAQVLP